jgi:purine-nucleoside phosphorylase
VTSSIAEATGRDVHRVAVVLGSGLSELAGSLVGGEPIPYEQLEGMAVSTVEGHQGSLYHGVIGDVPVLVFAGRVHLYEGHEPRVVTHWVRAARAAGCEVFVLTNAAGGLNLDFEVGVPCLISDHINLTGHNPLVGPNDPAGPRFLDQTEVYSRRLRELARAADPGLREGVYAGLLGPTYETPAEVRMLQTLGADLVGMSTVLEAIQARHLGGEVLGISVVTNHAAGLSPGVLSHDEVAAAGKGAAARLENILRKTIAARSF